MRLERQSPPLWCSDQSFLALVYVDGVLCVRTEGFRWGIVEETHAKYAQGDDINLEQNNEVENTLRRWKNF